MILWDLFIYLGAFILLLGLGASAPSIRRAVRARREQPPKPTELDLSTVPAHPTLHERWLQENEHVVFQNWKPEDFTHTDCRVCGPGPLKNLEVPSAYPHVFYKVREFTGDYGARIRRNVAVPPYIASVVSSEIAESGYHTVMLDIDVPARLIESSTPGHYHLYVDVPVRWPTYRRLLKSLARAGVIEKGYAKVSINRRGTHLRVPWKQKELV